MWQSDMMLLCAAANACLTGLTVIAMVLFSVGEPLVNVCSRPSFSRPFFLLLRHFIAGQGSSSEGEVGVKLFHVLVCVVLVAMVAATLCARVGGHPCDDARRDFGVMALLLLILIHSCFTAVTSVWWVDLQFGTNNPHGIDWNQLSNQTALYSKIEVRGPFPMPHFGASILYIYDPYMEEPHDDRAVQSMCRPPSRGRRSSASSI